MRGELALAAAISVALAAGCLERRSEVTSFTTNECVACHGDASNGSDPLIQSAPPNDLYGNTDSEFPGVGAHQIHLHAGETHGAVACVECHQVPTSTDEVGHADTRGPADLVFGELARSGERVPAYDVRTRRCSDTYCHRTSDNVWTRPRLSADACGSCHGLPPAAPHPAGERCSACHGEVVADDNTIRAPQLHVDGEIQVVTADCSACHGQGDDPAPPVDLAGSEDRASLGVGAHQRHLSGGDSSRPLACEECHLVPTLPEDEGHLDDGIAEVIFSGVGLTGERSPSWSRQSGSCVDSWCHGPVDVARESPPWTSEEVLACDACHGAPPAAPHPQLSDCGDCHETAASGDSIANRALHVDGTLQVSDEPECHACHGDDSTPAPPLDTTGAMATSSPGVGAHRAHLEASAIAPAISCETCHVVPAGWLDSGHIDTALPAEVDFSGLALLWNAQPSYAELRCSNTYCHGAAFVSGHDSGGTLTEPTWNVVDGSQSACGTCHGLPPPAPHPAAADPCSQCHENIADDNRTFIRPDLHVDGDVTFRLQ